MKKAKKKIEEDLQQHKPRQNAPFAHYKWRLIFIILQIANRWEQKKVALQWKLKTECLSIFCVHIFRFLFFSEKKIQ